MASSGASPARRALVFLAFVMSVAIVIYMGIGASVVRSRGVGARPGTDGFGLFILGAGFACLAGAFFAGPRGSAETRQAPPIAAGIVRARLVRALMLSTAGPFLGLVGTFLTHRLALVLILGAGALALNLLWALPQALRLLGEAEAPTTTG